MIYNDSFGLKVLMQARKLNRQNILKRVL